MPSTPYVPILLSFMIVRIFCLSVPPPPKPSIKSVSPSSCNAPVIAIRDIIAKIMASSYGMNLEPKNNIAAITGAVIQPIRGQNSTTVSYAFLGG